MKLPIAIFACLVLLGCTYTYSDYVPQRTYQECRSIKQCASTLQIAIADNWSRPESATNHLQVLMEISLDQEFSAYSIQIIESSGMKEYDDSAMSAAKRASPFSELAGLDNKVFQEQFSRFILLFDPNDLGH